MPFPKTLDDMIPEGYSFGSHSICRGCGNDIEWWKTPSGKNIPMNPMTRGDHPATAHWSTCSESESFRRKP